MELRKIFVLGTTEYSFMLSLMIEQENQFEIIGHTCSKCDIEKNTESCQKHKRDLYVFEELQSLFNFEIYILNTLGYSSMNRNRQKMSEECRDLGYKEVGYISKNAIVLSKNIGTGNIIFPQSYIGTNVELGNNNVVYAGAVLTHDIRVGNNNFVAAGAVVGGMVEIGNNCFIGMNSTIKNRITVSDYSLVGAGAYVAKSTSTKSVIVPEKSIELDKESFDFFN